MSDFDQTQAIFLDLEEDTDNEEIGEKKALSHLKVHFQKGFLEKIFPLYDGDNIIGRHEESCGIYIPLPALSRQHACVEIKGSSHFIYDMGSRNKTRKGKAFLTPQVRYELKHNDTLLFGDVQSTYLVEKLIDTIDSGSETGSESMFQTAPPEKDNNNEKPLQDEGEEFNSDTSEDILQPTQSSGVNGKMAVKKKPVSLFHSDSDSDDSAIKTKGRWKNPDVTVKDTPAPRRQTETSTIILPESGSDTDDEATPGIHDMQTLMIEDTQKDDEPTEKDMLYAPTQAYIEDSDSDMEDEIDECKNRKSGIFTAQTQDLRDDRDRDSENEAITKNIMEAPTQAFVEISDSEEDMEASTPVNPVTEKTVVEVVDDEENVSQLLMMPTLACDANIEQDDDIYEQATQVFCDVPKKLSKVMMAKDPEDPPTQVLENSETQVFEDVSPKQRCSGKRKQEVDANLRTARSSVMCRDQSDDSTQIFEDATVPISVHESPKSKRKKKIDGDATQDFTDNETVSISSVPENENKSSIGEKESSEAFENNSEEKAALALCQGATLDIRKDDDMQEFGEVDGTIEIVKSTVASNSQLTSQMKTPRQRCKQIKKSVEDATQVFGDEDATVTIDDDATSAVGSDSARQKGKPVEASKVEDTTQVFGDEDATVTIDDATLAVSSVSQRSSRQKRTPAKQRGKPVEASKVEDATQVFGDEDATVPVDDDTLAVSSVLQRSRQKRTPAKQRGKPVEASKVEDTTQVFGDEDATVPVDDDTLAVSSVSQRSRQKRTPAKQRGKPVEASKVEDATQVFGDEDATVPVDDDTLAVSSVSQRSRQKRTPAKQRGKPVEASKVEDATQVFGDEDATVTIDDATLAVSSVSQRSSRQKRTPAKQRGKPVEVSKVEDATQVFGDEDATVPVDDDTLAVSSVSQRSRQKRTPAKQRGKPVEASKVEDATQVFGDEDATVTIDDATLAVSSVSQRSSRQKRTLAKQRGKSVKASKVEDATQVFGDEDATVTIDDDATSAVGSDSARQKGKPVEASKVEDTTQVFGDEDATVTIDDDTLAVSSVSQRSRQKRTPAKQRGKPVEASKVEDTTQVFGDEDATVTIDDDTLAVSSVSQRSSRQKRTPAKQRGKPVEASKVEDATQAFCDEDATVTIDDAMLAVSSVSQRSSRQKRTSARQRGKPVEASKEEVTTQVFGDEDATVVIGNEPTTPKRVKQRVSARQQNNDSIIMSKNSIVSKSPKSELPGNLDEGEENTDIEATQPYCDDDDSTHEVDTMPSDADISTVSAPGSLKVRNDNVVVRGRLRGRGRGRRSEPVVQREKNKDDDRREHLRRSNTASLTNAIIDLPVVWNSDDDTLEPTQPYCMGDETPVLEEEVIPDIEESVLSKNAIITLPSHSPLKSALAWPSPKKSPSPKRVHFRGKQKENDMEKEKDQQPAETSQKYLNISSSSDVITEDNSDDATIIDQQSKQSGSRKNVVAGRGKNKRGKKSNNEEMVAIVADLSEEQKYSDNNMEMRMSLPVISNVQYKGEHSTRSGRRSVPASTCIEGKKEVRSSRNRAGTTENNSSAGENIEATTVKPSLVCKDKIELVSARGLRGRKKKITEGEQLTSKADEPDEVTATETLSDRNKGNTIDTDKTEIKKTMSAADEMNKTKMKRGRPARNKSQNDSTESVESNQTTAVDQQLPEISCRLSRSKLTKHTTQTQGGSSKTRKTGQLEKEINDYTKASGRSLRGQASQQLEVKQTEEPLSDKPDKVPDIKGKGRGSRQKTKLSDETQAELDSVAHGSTDELNDSVLSKRSSKRQNSSDDNTKTSDKLSDKSGSSGEPAEATPSRKLGNSGKKDISETPAKKSKLTKTATPKRSGSLWLPNAAVSPSLRKKTPDCMPRVMFTGVVDEYGQKIVKDLGGELATSVHDCSHLVTDKVRRTVKFLCCVSQGIPIVLPSWLNNCKSSGFFTDHAGSLVKDPATEKQYKFSLQKTLDKANGSPLLKDYRVHVTKSVKPEAPQMKDILVCSGAQYMEKMPTCYGEKMLIISCKEDQAACEPALQSDIPVVGAEFILTGILRQEVDVDAYRIFAKSTVGKRQNSVGGSGPAKKRKR